MAKTGKRLKKAYEGIDPEAPPMRVDAAVKEVKSRASAKFDETVEVAMNLNLDPLFESLVPTTENLCKAVFQILKGALPAMERLQNMRIAIAPARFLTRTARDQSSPEFSLALQ